MIKIYRLKTKVKWQQLDEWLHGLHRRPNKGIFPKWVF